MRDPSTSLPDVYRELHRQLAYTRAITDSLGEGICAIDIGGLVTFLNPAGERLLGWKASELLGRNLHKTIHFRKADGSPYPAHECPLLKTVRNGEARHVEGEVFVRRDGTSIPVSYSVAPIRSPEGDIEGAVEVFLDVTERTRAMAALARSEERTRLILDHALDAVITMDRSGRIIGWNHEAERIFGWPRAEVVGRPLQDVCVPERFRQAHREGLARFLETGEARILNHRIELVGLRRNGEEFPVELSITAIPREGDVFFSGFLRDITPRQESERQLKVTQEELRVHAATLEQRVADRTAELAHANEELEAFSYSVSHDLRASLRAMEGFTRAIVEDYGDRLDDTGRDYARRVVDAANQMESLMNDLLAYAKLGRGPVRLEPLRLAGVVGAAADGMRHEVERAGGALTIEIPDDLPDVLADRTSLLQAISNLISNAVKFTRPGVPPSVRIHAERNGGVRLWIEDNGIGIPPENRQQIFGAFQRLHTVDRYPGTGVGLAIVRRAVERVGGRVGVESEPGVGSRFWIELAPAGGGGEGSPPAEATP